MHTPSDVVGFASRPASRRLVDPLRYAPLLATVFAVFALIKSAMFHGYGQLRDEQITTLVLAGLSVPCLMLTVAWLPRYRTQGRRKVVAMALLCVLVVTCDALALWNLSTATVGAKDRLF